MEAIKGILLDFLKCEPSAVDALLAKYDTNLKLSCATENEISAYFDGDMSTSVCIKLIFSLISRRICDGYKLGKSHTKEEFERYLSYLFLPHTEESVYIVSFDERGRAISVDFVTEGTVNALSVIPRKLIDIALKRRAVAVAVAHNHPSGFAIPSPEDVESTRVIRDALASCKIELLGHYVVSGSLARLIEI